MTIRFTRFFSVTFLGLLLSLMGGIPTSLAQQAFSDVPASHFAHDAVEFLKTNGFVEGYPDGTFKPEKLVNRAEATKFIIAPLVSRETLSSLTQTVYADIAPGDWYLPYVESARQSGVVDGPPAKTSFLGQNPVIKAEFLKMLLLGHKIDAGAYSEIRLPLSSDVINPDEWYYPFMRYAISSSMTMIGTNGLLEPGQQLSRGQTAVLLHRLIMYKENRRTQALLSEAESEILIILSMLEKNNIVEAEYASARALIAARGAHAAKPDDPTVIGALKTTEAFRALVRAYRAGLTQDFDTVIQLAKDAWSLADTAKMTAPSLNTLATQVQKISQEMADSARTAKGEN